jgi:hypothetical protein
MIECWSSSYGDQILIIKHFTLSRSQLGPNLAHEWFWLPCGQGFATKNQLWPRWPRLGTIENDLWPRHHGLGSTEYLSNPQCDQILITIHHTLDPIRIQVAWTYLACGRFQLLDLVQRTTNFGCHMDKGLQPKINCDLDNLDWEQLNFPSIVEK